MRAVRSPVFRSAALVAIVTTMLVGIQPAAAATNASWSEKFGASGASNSVQTVATSGATVYIGLGSVTTFGGVNYNHIAKWDGQGWRTLGAGVNGAVDSIAVLGADVFVAGDFTMAGGQPANHVAMWNGTVWSPLGGGISNSNNSTAYAYAIAATGTATSPQVYVGGSFDTAGGQPATDVAEWDGSGWHALGSGLTDFEVTALAVAGSTVYAGGNFHAAGTTPLYSLARWNGSAWSGVGGSGVASSFGFAGTVTAMAVSGTNLYISGSFDKVGGTVATLNGTMSGGVNAHNAAVWNGTSWSMLGAGLAHGALGLAYVGGKLYALGSFGSSGATSIITAWDGTGWNAVGAGLSGVGGSGSVVASGTSVVAAGAFTADGTGRVVLNGVGKWNGTTWTGYGLGMNSVVGSLLVSGTTVYAAGGFTNAGYTAANSIASFNGTKWTALGGTGTSGPTNWCGPSDTQGVCTMVVDPNTGYLYVGGTFTSINGVAANHVAVFRGSTWHAVGSGTDGTVNSLVIVGSTLIAGGHFANAGGVAASDIAQRPLSGASDWTPLPGNPQFQEGGAFDDNQEDVNVLSVVTAYADTYLLVAGGFSDIDNVPYCGVALYDVTNPGWFYFPADVSSICSGVGAVGAVQSAFVDGTNAYLAGSFTVAGGRSASGIAVANMSGTTGHFWSVPGKLTGSGPYAAAVTKVGSSFYFAGSFTGVNTVAATNIVQYTPGGSPAWTKLGSGVGTSPDVLTSLAQGSAGLYVGGRFAAAGTKPSANLALWTATAGQ